MLILLRFAMQMVNLPEKTFTADQGRMLESIILINFYTYRTVHLSSLYAI